MRKAGTFIIVAVIAAAVVASIAVATPGSGASSTILARGVAVEKVKTRGNGPHDVVVQHLVIAPGGHTGWHTHPGNAVAVIKTGALTIYDAHDSSCSPRTFRAGQTYIDPGHGHVHIGRNEGTVPLEVVVTYLGVRAGGGPVRIDASDPGHCSF